MALRTPTTPKRTPKCATPNGNGDVAFARTRLGDLQRVRVVAAMIDVAAERGVAGATVAHVVSRSGVSRRTYYEVFPDRDACFIAAFDASVERAGEYVLPAYRGSGSWQQSIRAGLVGLLSFLDAEPAMGRLLVVESLAAGPVAVNRRRELIALLTATVHEGRSAPRARRNIPPLTAEGVVGAVLSVIHSRLTDGDMRPLVELTGALMGIVVLPYLGARAVQQELSLPIPSALPVRAAPSGAGGGNGVLLELPMRLTYRTIRVLSAIARAPGASNREIGRSAGIEDQGQTSKLLKRLSRLDLIQNGGEGPLRGAPNEWTLTPTGHEVANAIPHTP